MKLLLILTIAMTSLLAHADLNEEYQQASSHNYWNQSSSSKKDTATTESEFSKRADIVLSIYGISRKSIVDMQSNPSITTLPGYPYQQPYYYYPPYGYNPYQGMMVTTKVFVVKLHSSICQLTVSDRSFKNAETQKDEYYPQTSTLVCSPLASKK